MLHENCKEGICRCYQPIYTTTLSRTHRRGVELQEPENAEVRCNLSYALLKECKYNKALEAADGAVAIDPTMERAQFRKGLAHAALEE